MNTQRPKVADKELWRRLAPAREGASVGVSELDFAAWLEGRLPEAAMARVEAAIAVDPELRRAALELADVLAKPLPAAPERMAVRAKALVGFEAERPAARFSWLTMLLPIGMPRGAMAGIALTLAVMGFVMGGGLGESYAYQRYEATSLSRGYGGDPNNELADLFALDSF